MLIKRLKLSILFFLIFLFLFTANAYPKDIKYTYDYPLPPKKLVGENWNTIKSIYFIVKYKPDANLKKIEKKLRRRHFFVSGLKKPKSFGATIEQKIAYRLDRLMKRAQEILAMNPKNMRRVYIYIFKKRKDVIKAYYKLTGKKVRIKSFYTHRYKTIIISEKDISDSILAHEIGHVIVDHYFLIKPPPKVRELLSNYVDLHLEEDIEYMMK